MRRVDPVAHHLGERAHLLVRRADAQQHRRQLLLGAVALEQVGDLAAQIEALECHVALEELAHLLDALARARTGEVEQVGRVEEIPRLFGDRDLQLGDQRRHVAAAELGARAGRSHDPDLLARVGAQPAQRVDVDDRLLAWHQRFEPAMRAVGESQRLERGREPDVELGEVLDVVPDQREQLAAMRDRQLGRQRRGARPVVLPQRADAGLRLEVALEILLQVVDVVLGQAVGRLRRRERLQLLEALGDRRDVGMDLLRLVAVGVVAVADDLDDVGLRQEAQRHRHALRGLRPAQGEAGHETRRLLAALGVEVLDEVEELAVEIRHQGRGALPRQRRDQVGLARLARPEHRDRHRPLERRLAFLRRERPLAEVLVEARALGAHLVGIGGEPGERPLRRLGGARSDVAAALVGGAHRAPPAGATAGCAARVRPGVAMMPSNTLSRPVSSQ